MLQNKSTVKENIFMKFTSESTLSEVLNNPVGYDVAQKVVYRKNTIYLTKNHSRAKNLHKKYLFISHENEQCKKVVVENI